MCAIATDQIRLQDDHRPERGKMSQEDVAVLAETAARQLLGVSADEAFTMLDRGELDGSFAASAMRSLRFLLNA